jgi:acetyl-CoA synthetase
MLQPASSYDDLLCRFRWRIPERYNIAVEACDAWAARGPDRLALIHLDEDGTETRWTYGQLAVLSNRMANALAAKGVSRGDRVALLLPQSPQTLVSHLALYKLGAIVVPLANLFGVDALQYRLENSGASAAITDASGIAKLAEIREVLPALRLVVSTQDTPGDVLSFAALLAGGRDVFVPAPTGPDDPAMMIYTSGTTGPPKGALHGHRVLAGHLPGIQMAHEFLPQPGDLFWTPADWAWAGGLLNALLPSLALGVPVVSHRFEKFDPERAFQLLADQRVRNAFIPPTALKMLRTVSRPRLRFDLALRSIGSAGEALGRETYDWARHDLGLTVNEFYGQTECNAVLASCGALGVSRAGAIGKPVPGHTVAVVDDDGAVCAPGAQGQIAILRPDPVMFLRYWGEDAATEAKFVGDWMLTGDRGECDADGYVHFVGRTDDIITSSGYRIGPGEIEDCLLSHPAVALAAAVGKPDPVRTEIVKAFVVLTPGTRPGSELEEDIRAHVRTRLSAHEYPREIEFVDALPMTTTGKVIRRLLRADAEATVVLEE